MHNIIYIMSKLQRSLYLSDRGLYSFFKLLKFVKRLFCCLLGYSFDVRGQTKADAGLQALLDPEAPGAGADQEPGGPGGGRRSQKLFFHLTFICFFDLVHFLYP